MDTRNIPLTYESFLKELLVSEVLPVRLSLRVFTSSSHPSTPVEYKGVSECEGRGNEKGECWKDFSTYIYF